MEKLWRRCYTRCVLTSLYFTARPDLVDVHTNLQEIAKLPKMNGQSLPGEFTAALHETSHPVMYARTDT